MTDATTDRGSGNTPADAGRMVEGPVSKRRIAIGAALLLVLAAAYWILSEAGVLATLADERGVRRMIERLGAWGPLAIIALEAAAIVMSPIPSAPIALAAGAAYGPIMGTLYIVLGAEAGAVTAFAIARWLGYQAVRRRLHGRLSFLTRERSQMALMAIVFASRLVPFISFDAVSYAAGLTPLSFWRFAAATLAGVIPISFLLAYFGEALLSADTGRVMLIVLLAGGITVVPFGIRFLWRWYRRRKRTP